MTVEVKLADGTVVKGEMVRKQTTVKAVDRTYTLAANAPRALKSKQRQIVTDIMLSKPGHTWSIAEIAKIATEKGLHAVAGVAPSVQWHLHQMVLAGHVTEK